MRGLQKMHLRLLGNRRRHVRRDVVLLTGLLGIFGMHVVAQDNIFSYGVNAGISHSDNVTRVATNEVSTSSVLVGGQLDARKENGRLRYSATGDLTRYEYLNSSIDAELVGQILANGEYSFIPDRLKWNFDALFGQVREDLLRPAAPGNREDLFSYSTGPQLTINLAKSVDVELTGQFASIRYENRGFNNETVGAGAVVLNRFSPNLSIGVGYSYNEINYQSTAGLGAIDFSRDEGFIRLLFNRARTGVRAEFGYSTIKGAGVSDDGPLVRAQLTHRISPSWTGFVGVQKEFPTSDPTSLVQLRDNIAEGGSDLSFLTAGPRQVSGASMGFNFARPRTTAGLTFSIRQDSSKVLGDSRDYNSAELRITRRLGPRLTGAVYVFRSDETIDSLSSDAQTDVLGISTGFAFGRNLTLDARVEYQNRSSNRATNEYSEFSGTILLRYGRSSAAR